MVVAPDGEVVAEASHEDEDTLLVTLDSQRVDAARSPFAHLRDEDPAFFEREIQRLLGVRHQT